MIRQMMCQPTPWACYPTAVSIVTGIDYHRLLRMIGHDGSKIVDPDKAEPWCREGFSNAELSWALYKLGWSNSYIWAAPLNAADEIVTNYPTHEYIVNKLIDNDEEFVVTIQRDKAYKLHSLAYTEQFGLCDPLTGETNITWDGFSILSFEILRKM